jgi:gamma-glutamyltranspeptidase/glutathione hydrolase
MLMLLSGYRGKASLADLCRAGVAAAEGAGAKDRAKLIRKVGAAGVLALRAPEIERALLAAAGPVAGGALTAADVEEATPTEGEALAAVEEGLTVYTTPVAEEAPGDAEVIVACDGRGGLAAITYVPVRDGVPLPGFEVTLGGSAVPVRRGVTRVPPGTLLPSPAPVAIAVQSGGFAVALALPGRPRVDPADAAAVARSAPIDQALADLRDRTGGRPVVAVVTDGKAARALVV